MMTMKLAQVPPIGAPRPYATHYYTRMNVVGAPQRVGHCASRKGAVIAAVKRLSTVGLTEDDLKNPIMTVHIYDDFGVLCNTVERRKDVVAVKGYY